MAPVDYTNTELQGGPTVTLNNGQTMPVLGLGTWRGKDGVVGEAVKDALRCGYRHIDCAKAYGNQDEVGRAFTEIFKEGKISRKDVWITSKLWNPDHAAGDVENACRETIKALQCEYLDLYLVHWPVSGGGPQVPYKETWQAVEQLVGKGLCKSIGVSNLSSKKLGEVLGYAKTKPAVNQVELHPYFRNDQLATFCKEKGVHITQYSPLGSPDSAQAYKDLGEEVPHVLHDKVVEEIAKEQNATVQQVLIRWAIQFGNSVIPKASSRSHVEANFRPVLDMRLTDAQMHRLSTIEFQMRVVDGTDAGAFPPSGPWKTLQDLWDGEVPKANQEVFERHFDSSTGMKKEKK